MEKQVLFWSRAKLAKDNGIATESARWASDEYPDDVVEGDEKLGIFEVSVHWSGVTFEELLGLHPRYS